MEFFQRRKNAQILTTIIVIFTILIGFRSSMGKLRTQAESIFYLGEEQNGVGIQQDLEAIMAECYNLTVVAGRYLEKDDARIQAVMDKREALSQAKTPDTKYDAVQELIFSSEELYRALEPLPLSDRDQGYRNGFLAEINSRQLIIERSSYNEYAIAYNKKLKAFPANILKIVTSVAPLELYE
ncbi:LemA family protein [Alkaliphilus crotonatoxidans]